MFDSKKCFWLHYFSSILTAFAVASPLCISAAEAEAKAVFADTDGDTIPDDRDPMPLIANFPLYWQVRSFSITRVGEFSKGMAWAKQSTLDISESPGIVKLAYPSTETIAPSVLTTAASQKKQHPYERYGIAGSDTFKWGRTEKLRLSRFAEGNQNTELQLNFTVHIVNYTGNRLFGAPVEFFKDISVPVKIGKKVWSTAVLANEAASKNGVIIPTDGKVYPLEFKASIPADKAGAFLNALVSSGKSPIFAISESTGFFDAGEDPASYSLRKAFASVSARSSVIRIENFEGQQWSWYVAKKRPDGKKTNFAEWIESVNGRFAEDTGRPLVNTYDMKYVTSVAGWDSGNWDMYWSITSGGKSVDFDEWLDLPLSRDIMLDLVPTPPEVPFKEMWKLLDSEEKSGVLASVFGASAWARGDKNTAFALFKAAAKLGAPNGMSWLGKYHSQREQVKGENDRATVAAAHYQASAEAGYAPGQAWYGRSLLLGDGVEADPKAAIVQLKNSSDQGYPEGMALYAICLLNGRGTERNTPLGIKLSEEAAKKGSTTAQIRLAVLLLNAKSEDGIDWLHVASDLGNTKAMTRLGKVYRDGELGTEQNLPAAVALFEKAAKEYEPQALVALGELYNSGIGVRLNQRKAAQLFHRAATRDNKEGQTLYALSLLEGTGGDCNYDLAVWWLRQASNQNYALAKYILALCTYCGIGCEKSPEKAYTLFADSARAQPSAYIFMGNCHYTGNGAEKSPEKAFAMFKKAADAGLPAGDAWLAYCYGNGIGVARNVRKARELARKAIDAGCAGALGILRSLPSD